jgi:hypothetical protein
MTEPKEELKEAKPEPKQTTTKDAIRIMLKAFDLAEEATGYKEAEKVTMIYFNNGENQTTDPTLAAYIKKAEKMFIKQHGFAIIKEAKELLQIEIDEIRELLG